ncbi:MAG: ATP-binding cassette domain-containing protein [Terriglobales bacterium]
MAAVLEFENLSREYRGFFGRRVVRALDGLSLSVEAGEIFGFLGPNGAGKTTAIHIAMGLLRPSSGGGRMLGKPFGDAPTRSRVGLLAENVALYHRPAGRLVRFYGALNGMRDPELAARTREVLEAVDLAADAGRNVGRFSRGMLQRVGLAQALVNDPELLILDEPTSALDPLGRVAVRELLLRMKAQGKTIFLSSHLLSEVELICDRVAILHRGKLARLGKTAELVQSGEQAEIVARGIDAGKFGGEAADGVVTLRVLASAQRATIERVWAAGGEIVSVNPARKSLEEIFVELTKQERSCKQ